MYTTAPAGRKQSYLGIRLEMDPSLLLAENVISAYLLSRTCAGFYQKVSRHDAGVHKVLRGWPYPDVTLEPAPGFTFRVRLQAAEYPIITIHSAPHMERRQLGKLTEYITKALNDKIFSPIGVRASLCTLQKVPEAELNPVLEPEPE